MSKGKLFGALLAMLGIGAVFFSGLAALVNWRMGTPLAVSVAATTAAPSGAPLEALRQGVLQSVTIAWRELQQQQRTRAVMALDAAKRAADVGKSAAGGETGRTFDYVYHQMEHARASLQDGEQPRAEQILADTVGTLTLTPTGRISPGSLNPPPAGSEFQAYAGARVLNPRGVRIGEVERASGSLLTLRLGGDNDVLGFIDLGRSRRITVPAKQILFGKRKTLGSTMVVLD